MTKEYFLERANRIYGEKFIFPDLPNVFNNKLKIKVICPIHGEFKISVVNFLNGRGCKFCNKENRSKKYDLYAFLEKARKVHNNKYVYSKVIYKNQKEKVCIICPEHGEFFQTPGSHLQGRGCPKCANSNKNKNSILTTEEFILRAREIHGWKYDYSKVEYKNNSTKVCIICPEHGEFLQTPNNHLNGEGCPKCAGKQKTFNDFKKDILQKYGDIYDFSVAEKEFNGFRKKITVGYNGKFFMISPSKIILGNKNGKPITMKRVYNKEDFIKRAKEVHGDKYDYSKVIYKNSHTKVCIICPEHGEFFQTPNMHLNGCDCPICSKESKRSKTEEIVMQELIKRGIKFIEQYSPYFLNNGLSHQKVDFYLPEYKIAIECQGQQHFVNSNFFKASLEENVNRDIKKKIALENNEINVIYFLEKHVKMKSVVNNEKFGTIYTKENTFKSVDKMLNYVDKNEFEG